MPATIEPLRPEDTAEFLRAMSMTFLQQPALDGLAARAARVAKVNDPERTRVARDGGRIVATHRTMPMDLTLPGGATVACDSVSAVTVAPTHRRQGILTAMMTEGLRGAADRGEPVSALYASEWPIYGRYGFGAATQQAGWEVSKLRVAPQPPPTGVELIDPADLVEASRPAYERARLARAGGLSRPDYRWPLDFGQVRDGDNPPDWRGYAAVHRDAAGEIDGYLLWHSQDKWENWRSDSVLHVDELITATPEAYRELWRFALSVDLIVTVRAEDRPVDEVIALVPGIGRGATMVEHSDGLWLRILDVAAVLTARSYGSAGRLVVEVSDPRGFAGGTYALEAGPDGATCKPSGESAELTLPVSVLSSVVLGGYRLRTLADAGLVDEHAAGAVERANRLLGTDVAPWCQLHF